MFVQDVIKNSKHQNPFIYLKGVSKKYILQEEMAFQAFQESQRGHHALIKEKLEKLLEKHIGIVLNREEHNRSINYCKDGSDPLHTI